jgi:hypothetical protein
MTVAVQRMDHHAPSGDETWRGESMIFPRVALDDGLQQRCKGSCLPVYSDLSRGNSPEEAKDLSPWFVSYLMMLDRVRCSGTEAHCLRALIRMGAVGRGGVVY